MPLYGCPGALVSMWIYPVGDREETRGFASAFLVFHCADSSITVELDASFRVKGTSEITEQPFSITVGPNQSTKFGTGRGWPQLCDSGIVLKCDKVLLEATVTITKLYQVSGTRYTVIFPAGLAIHNIKGCISHFCWIAT